MSGPFLGFGGLVNHHPNEFGFSYIIGESYRMKLLRIGITGLNDKFGAVAFLFSLTDLGNGVCSLFLSQFIPVKAPDT